MTDKLFFLGPPTMNLSCLFCSKIVTADEKKLNGLLKKQNTRDRCHMAFHQITGLNTFRKNFEKEVENYFTNALAFQTNIQ